MNIKKLGNIFEKKKKIIFALEMGKEWVKAAASKEDKAGLEIFRLSARRVTSDEERAASEAIKGLIEGLELKEFTPLVSLPRHSVTMRYLKLPSTDAGEIEEMAKLQAIKQIPYPQDELIITHKILEKDSKGYSKIMLVVLHKKVLNKYLNIFKKNGLLPQLIALSSEAIDQYSILTGSLAKEDLESAVALIDIDLFFTEIQIQHRAKAVFSRSLHHGLRTLEDMNQAKNWMDEIKLSLNTYAREKDSVNITKVILTGAAWRNEGVGETLGKELKLPVKIIHPLQNIKISPEAKSKFEKSDYPLSFSSVIAVALSHHELKINLLPRPIRLAQEKKVKYKNLVNIGILAGCLILILGIFFFKKLYDKQVYLNLLKKKLEVIAPEAEALDKKAKMARLIKHQLKAEGSCLDIIREVYAVTPANIYLAQLIFEEGKGIALKGSSPGMSQIFQFIAILEDSRYFENVKLRYASKRKTKDADITDFEIYSSLR